MPMRGVRRFGVSSKLSPRYMGPFGVLERVGSLAYRLALPPQLAHIHDVSMLRKYVVDPGHVIDYHSFVVQEDASYIELPTSIVDRKEKVFRNRTISYMKVCHEFSNKSREYGVTCCNGHTKPEVAHRFYASNLQPCR
ncbi:uncharacterized protein LOC127811937 [Diospyros lotus]|uniref:uncharacterized protein LOC127811937 n=1 Tax=Diospyros lotus TaxID=55363 RepID=UPI00225B5472|nr:uncharacterized protein LOC127811937 [Diospyros lotus]